MIHNNGQSNDNGRLQGELLAPIEIYFEMSTGVASIGNILLFPFDPQRCLGTSADRAAPSAGQSYIKEEYVWLLQAYGMSTEICRIS